MWLKWCTLFFLLRIYIRLNFEKYAYSCRSYILDPVKYLRLTFLQEQLTSLKSVAIIIIIFFFFCKAIHRRCLKGHNYIWDKVFKGGLSKFCGIQPSRDNKGIFSKGKSQGIFPSMKFSYSTLEYFSHLWPVLLRATKCFSIHD